MQLRHLAGLLGKYRAFEARVTIGIDAQNYVKSSNCANKRAHVVVSGKIIALVQGKGYCNVLSI